MGSEWEVLCTYPPDGQQGAQYSPNQFVLLSGPTPAVSGSYLDFTAIFIT